ncbi:hypothetical protein TTHERM_000444890 (macronuclear) [Tetrahymena thermophila SB210]|uniref:Transmembrane protein n=1 Tax=Tetrahymena thermophila (strain SB210) TaxID=312017 RepID=W7WZS5_TETTS|nr:hypothetical protein TTHERM_000444890 [Tetrahymena thermophila SB210]EWS72345.1 hypothetical protein TTHERM_000444890 [Tetrahymena thermophila SB210]|eukprot:XP_012655122.1 hypothetical protein TTHERM_000444890 [Tetrahymena thermophila SB210]
MFNLKLLISIVLVHGQTQMTASPVFKLSAFPYQKVILQLTPLTICQATLRIFQIFKLFKINSSTSFLQADPNPVCGFFKVSQSYSISYHYPSPLSDQVKVRSNFKLVTQGFPSKGRQTITYPFPIVPSNFKYEKLIRQLKPLTSYLSTDIRLWKKSPTFFKDQRSSLKMGYNSFWLFVKQSCQYSIVEQPPMIQLSLSFSLITFSSSSQRSSTSVVFSQETSQIQQEPYFSSPLILQVKLTLRRIPLTILDYILSNLTNSTFFSLRALVSYQNALNKSESGFDQKPLSISQSYQPPTIQPRRFSYSGQSLTIVNSGVPLIGIQIQIKPFFVQLFCSYENSILQFIPLTTQVQTWQKLIFEIKSF